VFYIVKNIKGFEEQSKGYCMEFFTHLNVKLLKHFLACATKINYFVKGVFIEKLLGNLTFQELGVKHDDNAFQEFKVIFTSIPILRRHTILTISIAV
jgi:hypothetical protein